MIYLPEEYAVTPLPCDRCKECGFPEACKIYERGREDGVCEERDRVVAWIREWASVGRIDLYEMALEMERGEHAGLRYTGGPEL